MDNFTPKPPSGKEDIEKIKISIHDIFSLSAEEKSDLKGKILESKGIVRIMIHPYYMEQKELDVDHKKSPRVAIVDTGFKRILQTKSTAPVFLFEAYNQVFSTSAKIIPILKEAGNEIYMVPTFEDNPQPFMGYASEKRGEEWYEFIDLIKKLGVKKLVIGGMHLGTAQLSGCVGVAIEMLKRHFEIQVSALTSPGSRRDISKPDMKPEDF